MKKQISTTIIFAGLLIVTTVLLMLFPRQEHLVLSSILAVLFWLFLAAVVFTVCLLIKAINGRK